MIKLAMEIPVVYLPQWTPLTDLDFALAHRVLEDEVYADFYARRPLGRELIMDNSMHELGFPLPVKQLRYAAERIHADYVIAPDQLGQMKMNLEWFKETQAGMSANQKIAVVMCGSDIIQRAYFLDKVQDADMLCLPFREARYDWYLEQQARLSKWYRIHLLGINELPEAKRFNELARQDRGKTWSIDSSKPIKWGYDKVDMSTLQTIRGNGVSSLKLLDLPRMDDQQEIACVYNINLLRSILS